MNDEPKKIPELFDYSLPKLESYRTPEYSGKDLGLLALFELLNLGDWVQTKQIGRQPEKYTERPFPIGSSQLIGKHPSNAATTALMGAEAIAYPLITNRLEEPWKSIFQSVAILGKGSAVKNNLGIGLDLLRW